MLTPLDSLLEGFASGLHPRDWHGRFRVGDMVRLKGTHPNGDPIVGRIQRFTEDGKAAIIAPVQGGPHVEAGRGDIAFHSPQEAVKDVRRKVAELEKAQASSAPAARDPRMPSTIALEKRNTAAIRRDIARGTARSKRAPRVRDVSGPRGAHRSRWLHPASVKEAEMAGSDVLGALVEGFDDARHPRGFHGRFTVAGVAKMLRSGGRVTLPDGLSARRATGGFSVHNRAGRETSFHINVKDAARQVLTNSARSNHVDSLGGATRHANFEEFDRASRNAAGRAKRSQSRSVPGARYRGRDGRMYTKVAGVQESESVLGSFLGAVR